jgi:hypothetical protein
LEEKGTGRSYPPCIAIQSPDDIPFGRVLRAQVLFLARRLTAAFELKERACARAEWLCRAPCCAQDGDDDVGTRMMAARPRIARSFMGLESICDLR